MNDDRQAITFPRGPVVVTDALSEALQQGDILAAALEVTDPEPLPADHRLVNMSNCIAVPHTASATVQTRDRIVDLAARNLLAGLNGERPPASVNADDVLKTGHREHSNPLRRARPGRATAPSELTIRSPRRAPLPARRERGWGEGRSPRRHDASLSRIAIGGRQG